MRHLLDKSTLIVSLLLAGVSLYSAGAQVAPSTQTAKPQQSSTPPDKARSQAVTTGQTQEQVKAQVDAPKTLTGTLVDQVIAVVNGDLILESDVDEEQHFAAFQPFSTPGGTFTREKAVERLIDRTLILQQAQLQPDQAVSHDEAVAQLKDIRKDIPACKQAHCETDAGWQEFVRSRGFSMEELTERWRERMEILKYIEVRFRSGIQITPAEIKSYYDQTLLPEYAKRNAPAPKLEVISDRVQEVLLQQRVSSLLGDWLKSLKAQGTVRILKPDEEAR